MKNFLDLYRKDLCLADYVLYKIPEKDELINVEFSLNSDNDLSEEAMIVNARTLLV